MLRKVRYVPFYYEQRLKFDGLGVFDLQKIGIRNLLITENIIF